MSENKISYAWAAIPGTSALYSLYRANVIKNVFNAINDYDKFISLDTLDTQTKACKRLTKAEDQLVNKRWVSNTFKFNPKYPQRTAAVLSVANLKYLSGGLKIIATGLFAYGIYLFNNHSNNKNS